MCLIIAADTKKPTRDMLIKAEDHNGDGAGVAWFNDNGKAQYVKGLTAEEMYDFIQTIELPFVIHFRLRSIGSHDFVLNHPFVISKESPLALSGEADRLLVHNGHFSDWKLCLAAAGLDEPDKEPMSDTRAIAMVLGTHENENFLNKIAGKYVVINGKTQGFRMYGDFTFEDGMYFSNNYWKWTSYNGCNTYQGQTAKTYSPTHTKHEHNPNTSAIDEFYGEFEGWEEEYYGKKYTKVPDDTDVTKGMNKKEKRRYYQNLSRGQAKNPTPEVVETNVVTDEELEEMNREYKEKHQLNINHNAPNGPIHSGAELEVINKAIEEEQESKGISISFKDTAVIPTLVQHERESKSYNLDPTKKYCHTAKQILGLVPLRTLPFHHS